MGDIFPIIGLDTNIFMNVFREESGTESSAILLEQIESSNSLRNLLIIKHAMPEYLSQEDGKYGSL